MAKSGLQTRLVFHWKTVRGSGLTAGMQKGGRTRRFCPLPKSALSGFGRLGGSRIDLNARRHCRGGGDLLQVAALRGGWLQTQHLV